MKRLLTAGIFGTILGIVGAGTANASIVSSGFLDEKLTEYALSTSLDLKANQSDFTELNTQISDSIDNLKTLWDSTIGELAYAFDPNKVNNNINGAFDLVEGFILHSMLSLTDGWTSTGGLTYLGVKDLNTKTGSYLWGPENGRYKFSSIPYLEELFPGIPADISLADSDMATTILSNYTNKQFPGLAGVTDKLLNGWTFAKGSYIVNPGLKGMYDGWTDGDNTFPGLFNLSFDAMRITSYYGAPASSLLSNGIDKFTSKEYTGPIYPLWKLSQGIDQIGTLPSGNLPRSPIYELIFPLNALPTTYPTSLSDLIAVLFGDGEKNPGIINLFAGGLSTNGKLPYPVAGIIPAMDAATSAQFAAKNANDKIGTLPTGTPLVLTDTMENVNERLSLKYNINYPKSLSDLIVDLYGTTDPSNPGLLSLFTSVIADMVWPHEDALFGSSSNNIKGLLERMDNAETKIAKIGTLPTEIPNEDPIWSRYGFLETTGTPIILPDTIGEVLTVLFNEDASYKGLSLRNIMAKILLGFDASGRRVEGLENLTSAYNLTGDSPIVTAVKANTAAIEKIGTVPDGQTVAGMATTAKTTADSAIEKIGTLPTEYATVGAALSAIKGIAEEAKTAALAAIPDPKQEGSSGKFVLTVDIIGDNATYRWEKIDRESEPTTTE